MAAITPQPAPVVPLATRRRAAPRSGGWQLALAASVALLALAAALFFFQRWQASQTELAALEGHLRALEREVDQVSDKLALVVSSGSVVCPLRAMPGSPQPVARGTLFIAPGKKRWFLRLRSLAPMPADRDYQVWFETPTGPVAATTFRVPASGEVEVGSPSMPDETRAVFVTIEPAGGAEQPNGPMVLYGEEKMEVL